MDKKSKDRFEITELFMATAGRERFFTGIIKRSTDETGNPFVFSKIVMPDGHICAQASTQKELSKKLNAMTVMICDNGLHENAGVTTKIFNAEYFLN